MCNELLQSMYVVEVVAVGLLWQGEASVQGLARGLSWQV